MQKKITPLIILLLLLSCFLPLSVGFEDTNDNDPSYKTTFQDETYTYENSSTILIGNNQLELSFNKHYQGGIISILDKQTGINLLPDPPSFPTLYLFYFDNGTASEGALNWQAYDTTYTIDQDATSSTIIIQNNNLKGYDLHTTTTIALYENQPFVNMRLSIENNEDFTIQHILFPVVWGLGQIGELHTDDCVFYPSCDGVLLHDPLSHIEELFVAGGLYPGTLSMQLLCHFDPDETGLYLAAYDTDGHPKSLNYGPMSWDGRDILSTSYQLYPPETPGNDFSMDYDIKLGTFHGDWHTAASLYKQWAETTPFVSGGKVFETKDIPDWFDDTTIIQLLNRNGPDTEIYSLSDIVAITNQYSSQTNLDTTVLIIGWENNGAWVGPYYYPPVEGNASFSQAMDDLTFDGNHGFTYISGTVWRITRDDIGYADYELFNSTGLPWVALQRDQTPLFDPSYESIGWHSGRMCPMTEFWQDMVVYNALESVRLGCDVVQIDEFPISAIYPCYNASHGHQIGYSTDISDAYQHILSRIRTEGRAINADFIMSTEEPCEYYLPYLDTYVSRDCAPEGLLFMDLVNRYGDDLEFIPFFSFVYHEYITSFGEGLGMDSEYAAGFYNQMARAIGKMFSTGEIVKLGGTPQENWDPGLLELYTRCATATTTYAQSYLLHGKPLTPEHIDVPSIEIIWYNAMNEEFGTPIHEPAVYSSCWRADDQTKAYVFNNWYTDTIDFDIEIDDSEYPETYCALQLTTNGETSILEANTTLPYQTTLELDSNDIVLIEIISAIESTAPNTPDITGPTSGKINTQHTYTLTTTDPEGEDVSFTVDWGDGTTSGWSSFINSGDSLQLSHSWSQENRYNIKVKAKDINGLESQWRTLEVSMPKNIPLFHRLICWFSSLFPFFEHFLLY